MGKLLPIVSVRDDVQISETFIGLRVVEHVGLEYYKDKHRRLKTKKGSVHPVESHIDIESKRYTCHRNAITIFTIAYRATGGALKFIRPFSINSILILEHPCDSTVLSGMVSPPACPMYACLPAVSDAIKR